MPVISLTGIIVLISTLPRFRALTLLREFAWGINVQRNNGLRLSV
jgi:hypothetical protein